MSKYDAIQRFNLCFQQLETEINALTDFLRQLKQLPSAVFELPEVSKVDEHDEITNDEAKREILTKSSTSEAVILRRGLINADATEEP